LRLVLVVDGHFVVPEENCHFPEDVVFTQLAEALVRSLNCRLVCRNFRRVLGAGLLLRRDLCLLLLNLLLLGLNLLLALLNLLFRRR
jgi:hypothetical protein